MTYSDNLPDVHEWYKSNTPDRGYTIEYVNSREYAEALHKKHGYYVFNDEKALDTLLQVFREIIAAGLPVNPKNVRKGVELAGYEYLEFLKSFTGKMRPPVGADTGMRKAHPGGWADVTSNLVNSYFFLLDGKELTPD